MIVHKVNTEEIREQLSGAGRFKKPSFFQSLYSLSKSLMLYSQTAKRENRIRGDSEVETFLKLVHPVLG